MTTRAVLSVFRREGLYVIPLDVGFRRLVIRIWSVESHALGSSGLVDVGAQHVPALAQVQHSMVALSRPAPGAMPTLSLSDIRRSPTRNLGYLTWALRLNHSGVWWLQRPLPSPSHL